MKTLLLIVVIIAIIIIAKFFLDQNNAQKKNLKEGGLLVKFPNFIRFCNKDPNVKMEFVKDTGSQLIFRMPIITYGNIMGYLYLCIENTITSIMYGYFISKSGKKIYGLNIEIHGDITIDEYENNFIQIAEHLMSKQEYIEAITYI